MANSAGLAELAQRTLPDARIHVIPNGVDAHRFSPRPQDREREGGPVRLLFVGRLSPEKGLDILVESLAAPDAAGGGVAWALDVVGDGPERSHLQALAARAGLGDRLRLRGWLDRGALPATYQ